MKHSKTLLLATFVGALIAPISANAETIIPSMKTVNCNGKTFALLDQYKSNPAEPFMLYLLAPPTLNFPGMKDYTHNVKVMLPSGYDIRRATLSCKSDSLSLVIPSTTTGGFNKTGTSGYLNLMVTSSGRVYDLGDISPFPRTGDDPYEIHER